VSSAIIGLSLVRDVWLGRLHASAVPAQWPHPIGWPAYTPPAEAISMPVIGDWGGGERVASS
jgi:hypothetical protein